MKKGWLRLSFLFIVVIPLIFLSCSSVTSPRPGLNIVASVSQQTAGSITFRIGIENTGTKTETLHFGNTQFFDIEVYDRSRHLVWQWSYGLYFLDVLSDLEFLPGESQSGDTIWNLTGNDQKRIPVGRYTAKIYITSFPRDSRLSTVIELTI
jgi:hypothetical protein